MKAILIIILVCIFSRGYCQTTTANSIRFKSKISRVLTRENEQTDKWKKEDFIMEHLIVLDNPKRKITTYRETKEFELDMLGKPTKEVKNTITTYKYHCLDSNNKECDVIIQLLDGKPFAMHIDYPLIQFWYFLEE